MRIHTNTLTHRSLTEALHAAQFNERVAPHVYLITADERGSRTRSHAFEVSLGTYHKVKRDKRSLKNTGRYGADSVSNGGNGIYSATYAGWGWWIAELFTLDPEAVVGQYKSLEDFTTQTQGKFALAEKVSA